MNPWLSPSERVALLEKRVEQLEKALIDLSEAVNRNAVGMYNAMLSAGTHLGNPQS